MTNHFLYYLKKIKNSARQKGAIVCHQGEIPVVAAI